MSVKVTLLNGSTIDNAQVMRLSELDPKLVEQIRPFLVSAGDVCTPGPIGDQDDAVELVADNEDNAIAVDIKVVVGGTPQKVAPLSSVLYVESTDAATQRGDRFAA